MSRLRRGIALALALVGALTVATSAAGDPASRAQTSQKIAVSMTEYKFVLKPKTSLKRTVVFALKNNGSIGHDFKIAGKKSPVIAAGGARTLRVTFKKAGKYAFLCTLPSHAQAGMKGTLVVK